MELCHPSPCHTTDEVVTVIYLHCLTIAALYAVLAALVVRRTRETAIRLALGAHPRRVLAAVRWQGLRLVGYGVVTGMLIAVALTSYLGSLLYGVVPTDAPTLAGVLLTVLLATWPACQLPARRAARADLVSVLRAE